jgi:hypothetical protein
VDSDGRGLAAYLLQQENPNPVDFGDGAIVGLLAGVFGAIAFVIVSIPILMLAGFQASVFQRVMSNANEMPPEARFSMPIGAARGRTRHRGGFLLAAVRLRLLVDGRGLFS